MMLRARTSLLTLVASALVATSTISPAAPPNRSTVAPHPFRDCKGCPELIVVPSGTFSMGTPESEVGRFDWDLPPRKVSVRTFALAKFDVTRAEWAAFVSATHRRTQTGCAWTGRMKADEPDPHGSWSSLGFVQTSRHPVVCVKWKDAQDYVRWLSQKTAKHYRLPTEAEWEYAARAGAITPFFWGSKASHDSANYGADECCSPSASGRDKWAGTSPVGAFPPNAFGLFDMAGNVLQMVQDCLSFSNASLPQDGTAFEKDVVLQGEGKLAPFNGEKSCDHRVVRGGDWGDPPAMIRSSFRNVSLGPDYFSGGMGFRVARDR